ncbi:MAG: SEL1-like repeat protein [Planctomycetota bacterium]|nr:SEL1-like repeat protein [Planctomycetota bacterium]
MSSDQTPAPPSGLEGPQTGGLGAQPHRIAPQDLSGDHLLSGAPRTQSQHAATAVPELGGIPLLAKLGQGGMGAVYYGIHPRLDIEVAVKVLPFHLAGLHPDLVERFFREAKVAAQVRSPHLVGVTDVNQQGALYYIVMEFVRGQSAGTLVREAREAKRPPISEADALTIVTAATHGLCAAHEAGVIHRDIKPDNVLIPQRKNGGFDFSKAKLCDLGLARTEGVDKSLTGSYSSMGTPGFMAPEQGMDARTAGKPADIFSMGATLYALLAGHAPFHGSSVMKIMMDTAQQQHRPIRELRPDVTPTTEALLQRCLAKDPSQRYVDGQALLTALENCTAFPAELAETMRVRADQGASPVPPPAQTPVPMHAYTPPSSPSATPPTAPPGTPVPPSGVSGPPASSVPAAHTPVPASFAGATPLPPAPARSGSAGWLAAALVFLALLGGGGFFGWQHWSEQQAQRAAARTKALERQVEAEAALESWDRGRDRLQQLSREAGPLGERVWQRHGTKHFGEAQRSDLRRSATLGQALLAEGEHGRAEACFAQAETGARPGLDLAKKAEALLAALKPLHEELQAAQKEDAAFFAPALLTGKDLEASLDGDQWDTALERGRALEASLRAARLALAAKHRVPPARAAAEPLAAKAALKGAFTQADEAAKNAEASARAGDWAKAQALYEEAAEAYAGMPAMAERLGAEAVKAARQRFEEGNFIALQQALKDAEDLRPGDPALQEIRGKLAEARKAERKAAVKGLFTAQPEARAGLVELLREAAGDGDAEALNALGEAYFFGVGVARDFVQAGAWYRKAVDAGHVPAMHHLGELYLYGYGRPRDEAEAVRWFDKAGAAGDVAGLFRSAQCRWSGQGVPKDEKRALSLGKEALEKGLLAQAEESPRLAMLAGMYFAYPFIEQPDYAKAAAWLKRALVHPRAQSLLGGLILEGRLPGADTKEGLGMLEESARAGESTAMWALGYASENGLGVPKDEAKAREWYEKAARLGSREGMEMLGKSLYRAKEYADAFGWLLKAAEAGKETSMTFVGYALVAGEGVPKDLARGIEWYRKAADAGETVAARNLGNLYLNGQGVPKDPGKAFDLFRRSAEGGNSGGMANLSYMYRIGSGTAQDHAKALDWARKAAEQGEAFAMNSLGIHYHYGLGVAQDFAEAARWYEKCGQAGNAAGYRCLADLYDQGKGKPQDPRRASQLYLQAAQMDDGLAAAIYGLRLVNGTGVAQDMREGFTWIRKGTELGDGCAMRYLGACYEAGWGCEANLERAAEWFQKAIDAGDRFSKYRLGLLYRAGGGVARDPARAERLLRESAGEEPMAAAALAEMYRAGDGIPKNPAQAAYWYRKAADAGNANAMFFMGYFYDVGEGVAQDKAQAVYWYEKSGDITASYNLALIYVNAGPLQNLAKAAEYFRKAAEHGNAEAMYSYAIMLNNGQGVRRDPSAAFGWFVKAGQKNHALAMAEAGTMYATGNGVDRNYARAAEWLQKAADGGSDLGMYNLGVLYHNGWAVEKNLTTAVYWYRKAAGKGNADATAALKGLGLQ